MQSAIERYYKRKLSTAGYRAVEGVSQLKRNPSFRITRAATSNSFPKDNEKSQPQPQKKGKSSIIDSGDENRTLMHEINRFRSPELLFCLFCLNEFSSHDIVLHTK